jgi:hypothetical protein
MAGENPRQPSKPASILKTRNKMSQGEKNLSENCDLRGVFETTAKFLLSKGKELSPNFYKPFVEVSHCGGNRGQGRGQTCSGQAIR